MWFRNILSQEIKMCFKPVKKKQEISHEYLTLKLEKQ